MRTTTPLAILLSLDGETIVERKFVSLTLFPFMRNNVGHYLRINYRHTVTAKIVDRLRDLQKRLKQEPKHEEEPKRENIEKKQKTAICKTITRTSDTVDNADMYRNVRRCSEVVRYVREYHPHSIELRELNMLMWVWAIEKDLFAAQVFNDVVRNLYAWKRKYRIRIFIYSTAITLVQQLLLVHCNKGNLLPLIEDFFPISSECSNTFDTIIERISSISAQNMLCITNDDREARKAADSGIRVAVIDRDHRRTTKPKNKKCYALIASFDRIRFIN